MKLVELRTTSGDIEATASTHEMTIASTSGDVEVKGCYHNLTVNTISGDIDIELPAGIGAIAINTQTRSGDVTTRHHTDGVGPTVTGCVSSMSGDITIR